MTAKVLINCSYHGGQGMSYVLESRELTCDIQIRARAAAPRRARELASEHARVRVRACDRHETTTLFPADPHSIKVRCAAECTLG